MKLRTIISTLLLVAAATAEAHTHLAGSTPADKSRVAAPKTIELQFSGEARLTALSLQKGTAAAKSLTPLPAKAAKNVSVPVSALDAGDYVVAWRVAGADGHVMSGTFSFTVDPDAAPAAGKSGMTMPMHDHAKKSDSSADKHEH